MIVALAGLMVPLSVALISVGISHVFMQDQPNHARLCDDVVLSFRSAVRLPRCVGMQLQMGRTLWLQACSSVRLAPVLAYAAVQAP